MITANFYQAVFCAIGFVLLPVSALHAGAPKDGDGLVEFTSPAGNFRILLPGKPQYEKTTVGDAKEEQHQFKIGSAQGAYLVSYQENPNLRGSSLEARKAALQSGRDRLLRTFQGKLIENKELVLGKTHPGLGFRLTIPAANGEARCRFFMVGARLYQIMAIGMPEFVTSDRATQVLASFRMLK